MKYHRHALRFPCAGESLLGIVTRPEGACTRGVLILVGGPQYRVGSHRQFALLAHHLSEQGLAVMRFDYRGMGDSTGEPGEIVSWKAELSSALDAFFRAVPGLEDVVIWGLCEGASAASMFACDHPRVTGMILLNPWVRTPESEARAYLRHYYVQRLMSPGLWRKLITGEFDFGRSARSLTELVRRAARKTARDTPSVDGPAQLAAQCALSDRMASGLSRFHGPILLILSGNDLTAKEFIDVAEKSAQWRRLLADSRVTRHTLPNATHTFSSREWREQVASWTAAWVASW